MSRLTDAIKKCVEKTGEDIVYIFTGKVIDNSDAMINGTVQVQQITSKISSDIQEQDTLYSFNQQNSGTNFNEVLQNQAGPLIFTCYLQPEIGDYQFVIPVNNSYVTVCHTSFQDAFILGFQDIQYFSNSIMSTSQIMDSKGHTFSSNDTFINISNDIVLSVNDGSNLKLDTKVDLKSSNGAEIKMDTLISIKNSTTSMLNLMNVVVSALQDIATTTCANGTQIGVITPDLLIQITNLQTDINNLLTT